MPPPQRPGKSSSSPTCAPTAGGRVGDRWRARPDPAHVQHGREDGGATAIDPDVLTRRRRPRRGGYREWLEGRPGVGRERHEGPERRARGRRTRRTARRRRCTATARSGTASGTSTSSSCRGSVTTRARSAAASSRWFASRAPASRALFRPRRGIVRRDRRGDLGSTPGWPTAVRPGITVARIRIMSIGARAKSASVAVAILVTAILGAPAFAIEQPDRWWQRRDDVRQAFGQAETISSARHADARTNAQADAETHAERSRPRRTRRPSPNRPLGGRTDREPARRRRSPRSGHRRAAGRTSPARRQRPRSIRTRSWATEAPAAAPASRGAAVPRLRWWASPRSSRPSWVSGRSGSSPAAGDDLSPAAIQPRRRPRLPRRSRAGRTSGSTTTKRCRPGCAPSPNPSGPRWRGAPLFRRAPLLEEEPLLEDEPSSSLSLSRSSERAAAEPERRA